MILPTKQRLEEARHAGADRLYGYPAPPSLQPNQPPLYELKAVDAKGQVYFRRQMQWLSYVEAITHWQSLGTPNQNMLAEGEVA